MTPSSTSAQAPSSSTTEGSGVGGRDNASDQTAHLTNGSGHTHGASISNRGRRQSHVSAASSTVLSDAAEPDGLTQKEIELSRKRARDRKSQQAMRDRNKWTIQTLSDQVAVLSTTLEDRTRDLGTLQAKISFLEGENLQLRTQNAALQLSLMGRDGNSGDGASPGGLSVASSLRVPAWELYTKNTLPGCIADQILQTFVDNMRTGIGIPTSPGEKAKKFPLRPNLGSLMDKTHRSDDDISNVVADVLRTYGEIQELPKRVAAFYVMATLLKVSCSHPLL